MENIDAGAEPIGEVKVATAAADAPRLEYAAGLAAPTPTWDFLLAAVVFVMAHWVTDCVVTRLVVDVPRPVQTWWPGFWGRVFWAGQAFELVLAACAAAVLVAAQWLAWRLRPSDRPRRAWPAAVLAGWAFCAAGWGMYSVSNRPPFDSEIVQAVAKLILSAVLGGGLAWVRVFGRRRAG